MRDSTTPVITLRAEGTKLFPEPRKRACYWTELWPSVDGCSQSAVTYRWESNVNFQTLFHDAFHRLSPIRILGQGGQLMQSLWVNSQNTELQGGGKWRLDLEEQVEYIWYKHSSAILPGLFSSSSHTAWVHEYLPKFCTNQLPPPLGSLLGFPSVSLRTKNDILKQ